MMEQSTPLSDHLVSTSDMLKTALHRLCFPSKFVIKMHIKGGGGEVGGERGGEEEALREKRTKKRLMALMRRELIV